MAAAVRPPRRRGPHNFRASEENELSLRRVVQFFFWEQWHSLRKYCARKSIKVVGDIAIFVDYDSADVWAHRIFSAFARTICSRRLSRVFPPDYFSATGQRWGNPLYDWDKIRATGYQWWVQRLRWATQTCDFIRLDHFRGFAHSGRFPPPNRTPSTADGSMGRG
jgi:4-alpha-glucanotransferase